MPLSTHDYTSSARYIGGATLIGLMIGLLVSMIGILGSLSLYKTLTQTSVDATFDAKNDGNASLVLSQIGTLLQNTGFGLTTTDSPHITIPNPSEIIWREATDLPASAANVKCSRIIEQIAIAANDGTEDVAVGIEAKKILLQTITNTQSNTCHHQNALSLIPADVWEDGIQTVLSINTLTRLNSTYSKTAATQTLLNASLEVTAACSPYGMTPGDHSTILNITHLSASDTNNGSAPSLKHSVCLINP